MGAPVPAPGWYPDPAGSGLQQWWNGADWTPYHAPRATPAAPTPVPTPAPGWYPDPAGTGLQRYWDGAEWTMHHAPPTPHAPLPKQRGMHPAFVLLAVISLLVTALPVVGSNHLNGGMIVWLLWGGFWTVLWFLFAKGRR